MQSRIQVAGSDRQSGVGPARYFEVNVVFTTYEATRHALQAAGNLARNLNVHIRLIVLRSVPFAFPLTQPPVSVAFTERQFAALASNAGIKSEINVLICNCRNPCGAFKKILSPHSLVFIGGKRRIWPTAATRLAASLRSEGHEVVLTENWEGGHAGSLLPVHWSAIFCRLLGLH